MPRDESLQHKKDRIRPPRVQITYDVQVGDAQIKKELPFVVGVLADLAGHPDPDQEPLLLDGSKTLNQVSTTLRFARSGQRFLVGVGMTGQIRQDPHHERKFLLDSHRPPARRAMDSWRANATPSAPKVFDCGTAFTPFRDRELALAKAGPVDDRADRLNRP